MKRLLSYILVIVLIDGFPVLTFAKTPFFQDTDAIQKACESVLKLTSYDKNMNMISYGSGFLAFEDGVIVTNYHVINGGVTSVRARTEDGMCFDINEILCCDPTEDIAILKTNTKTGLDLLKLGDSDTLEKGSRVVAIGSPEGFLNTVSEGLYSGIYFIDTEYILFSAPVSYGSSGGALFNEEGEVVGITSATYNEARNLNFAVPIEKLVYLWENYLSGTYTAPYPEAETVTDPSPSSAPQPVTNPDLFGLALFLAQCSDGSYRLLKEDEWACDKMLIWDSDSECYYDNSSECWIWYNSVVMPNIWQYWYEGISSEYDDGWMEYDVDEQCWYIEASYANWLRLPSKYDVSKLWYISS